MAIQKTDFTIHGSKCIVLGLGEQDLQWPKHYKDLGAKVRVGISGRRMHLHARQ